jgi:hypothetical protein
MCANLNNAKLSWANLRKANFGGTLLAGHCHDRSRDRGYAIIDPAEIERLKTPLSGDQAPVQRRQPRRRTSVETRA